MTDLLLTNDYMKRRSASSVPTAHYVNGSGWWFDADDDIAVRVACQLFPNVRAQLPVEVAARIAEQDRGVRPPLLSEEWYYTDSVAAEQLLRAVPKALLQLLYPYQAVDTAFHVSRMLSDGGAYNGHDRGLGKTLSAIVAAKALQCDKIVVVCPNSSKDTVWRPELEQWDIDHQWAYLRARCAAVPP